MYPPEIGVGGWFGEVDCLGLIGYVLLLLYKSLLLCILHNLVKKKVLIDLPVIYVYVCTCSLSLSWKYLSVSLPFPCLPRLPFSLLFSSLPLNKGKRRKTSFIALLRMPMTINDVLFHEDLWFKSLLYPFLVKSLMTSSNSLFIISHKEETPLFSLPLGIKSQCYINTCTLEFVF